MVGHGEDSCLDTVMCSNKQYLHYKLLKKKARNVYLKCYLTTHKLTENNDKNYSTKTDNNNYK